MYLFRFLIYTNEISSEFVIKIILLALCFLYFSVGTGRLKEVGSGSHCVVKAGLGLAVLLSLLSVHVNGVRQYALLFPLLCLHVDLYSKPHQCQQVYSPKINNKAIKEVFIITFKTSVLSS